MLLAQSQDSAASASLPTIRNFANEVWSNRATSSRQARCSRATASNQPGRPKE
jgi:hypothetical protein